MKSKDLQPKLFYQAKVSFRIEKQVKSFPDKKKLMEVITTKTITRNIKGSSLRRRKKFKNMDSKMVINAYLSTIDSNAN